MNINLTNEKLYGTCTLDTEIEINPGCTPAVLIKYSSERIGATIGRILCKESAIEVKLNPFDLEDAIRDVASEAISNNDMLLDDKDREFVQIGTVHEFGRTKLMVYETHNRGWVVLGEYLGEMKELITYNPETEELYVDGITSAICFETVIKFLISKQMTMYAESLQ